MISRVRGCHVFFHLFTCLHHMKNRQKYIVQSEINSHRMLSLTSNNVMAIIVIAITKIFFFYVSAFKIHVESDHFTFQLGNKLWL